MVKALASHGCGPGSFPGATVTCGLSLLLVLVLAPRLSFTLGSPVFLPPQKSALLNANSIWTKSHLAEILLQIYIIVIIIIMMMIMIMMMMMMMIMMMMMTIIIMIIP